MLIGPPGGPRSASPDVPEPIDAVCLRALEKDPAQRYPSAAAFAEAIEQAAAAARLAIASNREVGALVRELGLRTSAEDLMQPSVRGRALSDPQIASEPSEARPGINAQTPLPGSAAVPRLGSLADVLEPEASATRLSSVVSEPLPPRSSLVERRGLLVGVAVAALLVGAGLVLAMGKLGGPSDGAVAGGVPAAPVAPDTTATTTASDPGGASSATAAPSASAARPPASAAAGATSRSPGSPAWIPKTATPVPRPGATNFRPTEL
jgi:serine/threonine-protein kinase